MAGETLLSRLQNGVFNDAPSMVKDYLAPIFKHGSSLSKQDQKLYSYYAYHYQKILARKMDDWLEEQVAPIVDCILDCFNCLKILKVAVSQSRKVMGHVIIKLVKKEFPQQTINLAKALHMDLCTPEIINEPEEADMKALAGSVYSSLWNASIMAQRQKEDDFVLQFEYRSIALRFLAIGQNNLSSLSSKFRITLERLPVTGTQGMDICQKVMGLFQDVFRAIKLGQSDVSYDYTVEGSIDVFVHLFKYLWLNSLTVEAETMVKLFQHFISVDAPLLGVTDREVDFLNGCASLLELVKSIIFFKTGQNAQKKNNLYKNELSGSLQNCMSTLSRLASSVNSKLPSLILTGLANCCSLGVDCLSKTISSCKPEMKSLLSNHLFDLYEIQAQLSEHEKAMWLSKGVDNLSKLENRRLEAVSLDTIISLSNRIHILVEKIYTADGVRKDVVMPYLTQCHEEMSKLYPRVLSGVNDPDFPLPIRQCYELGNLAHRAGRRCHGNGWLTETVNFLKIACEMFQKSNMSGDPKLSVKLWKRCYKGIVDAQRQNGDFEDAIHSVINGIMADPSSLAEAARYWAIVKFDISKSTKNSFLIQRTIYESFQDSASGIPEALQPMSLLEAELQAYKDYGGQITNAQMAVVELILSLSNQPEQKASALLDKARLCWALRKEDGPGTPVELCQMAKQLLEPLSVGTEKETLHSKDLLAKANFILYVVQTVDPVSIRANTLEQIRRQIIRQKSKAQGKDSSAKQDKDDGETYDICCTLSMERDAMKPIEKALHLWEECSAIDPAFVSCRSSTIDMLLVTANILQLTQRTTLQLRALRVASVICSRAEEPNNYLCIQTSLIEAMCGLKQPDQALQLTKTTDLWLKTNKLDTLKENVLYIYYLVAKSTAFFIAGKIQESYTLLVEAQNLRKVVCKAKGIDWMLTKGALCLIEYKFKELPKSVMEKFVQTGLVSAAKYEATALEILLRGIQQVGTVVSYVLGEWVMNKSKAEKSSELSMNVLEKWQILNRLMPSLLATGEECVKIGDPREALCYLNQGLLIAKDFQLPRWFAEFHLASARLETLQADYNGMQAHLHRVKFVLTSEVAAKLDEMQPNETDDNNHEDLDDFIKSKPMEVAEDVDHSFDLFDPCTSPTSKKEDKPLLPVDWGHPIGCVCHSCVDISLQKFNISQAICSAAANLSQGMTGPAETSLHQILQNFDHITQKSMNQLGEIVSTIPGVKVSKSPVVPSVYQDLLVDISIQMMTLGIDTDNTCLFEEWTNKAEELVTVSNYPWMMDRQGCLAEILYLKSVALLPQPQIGVDSAIEQLCKTMSIVKLKNVDPKDFATPYVGKKKLSGKCKQKSGHSPEQASVSQVSEMKAKTEKPIRNKRGRKIPQLPTPVEDTPITNFRFFKSRQKQTVETKNQGKSATSPTFVNNDPFDTDSIDFDSEEENQKPKAKRQTRGKRELKVTGANTEKQSNRTGPRNARSTKSTCQAIELSKISAGKSSSKIPVPVFEEVCEKPPVNQCKNPVKSYLKENGRKSNRNNKKEQESPLKSVDVAKAVCEKPSVNQNKNPVKSLLKESGRKSNRNNKKEQESALKSLDAPKATVTRSRRGKLATVTNCKNRKSEDHLSVYDFPDEEVGGCKSKPKTSSRSTAKRKPRSTRTTEAGHEIEQSRAEVENNVLPSIAELNDMETILISDEEIENLRAAGDSGSDDDNMTKRKRSSSRRRSGGRGIFMVESQETENPEVSRFSRVLSDEFRSDTSKSLQTNPEGVHDPKGVLAASESDDSRGMAYLHLAYKLLCDNPPTPTYRNTCHALSLMYMGKGDPVSTAFYLSEAQNATFRHIAITNIARKLRIMTPGVDQVEKHHIKRIKAARENLKFGKTVDEFRDIIRHINPDWTVCQISVSNTVKKSPSQMLVTRFCHDREPLTIPLSGYSEEQGQKLLQEHARIMKGSAESMVVMDKAQWWAQRSDLDEKLKEIVKDIEDHWLGCWKGALLGTLNETDRTKVEQTAAALSKEIEASLSIDVQILEILLSSIHLLSEREIIQAVHFMCGISELTKIEVVVSKIKCASKKLALENCNRNPVILILDKSIQHLPWEVCPILRVQQVTRVQSLQFLHAHYQMILSDPGSVHQNGIDPNKVFYIVNPENNLPDTEAVFRDWFQRESKEKGWNGVIGSAPSRSQFIDAVTNHDLFIYCGHGSGSRFFSGDSLKVLQCRAATMLMGCSSGLLVSKGQLEATGVVLNYFLAGCPSVVANLWDVTDKDIDRFLKELLNSWLTEGSQKSLLAHMLSSRNSCKLPYLIGAAPVVYGLPVRLV